MGLRHPALIITIGLLAIAASIFAHAVWEAYGESKDVGRCITFYDAQLTYIKEHQLAYGISGVNWTMLGTFNESLK